MKRALWIKGLEGMYKILPDGSIYSFVRNQEEGKLLKPRLSGSGYLMVTLNGVQRYVHQIIAEHYIINPNKRKYKIVGFKDGNPKNIKISNLFWTNSDGRSSQYSKNKKKILAKDGMVNSKISKENLVDIARLMKNSSFKNKQERISKLFGICRITLYRIRQTKEFKRILETV